MFISLFTYLVFEAFNKVSLPDILEVSSVADAEADEKYIGAGVAVGKRPYPVKI